MLSRKKKKQSERNKKPELDELQEQKSISGCTPVSQEEKSVASVGAGSPEWTAEEFLKPDCLAIITTRNGQHHPEHILPHSIPPEFLDTIYIYS